MKYPQALAQCKIQSTMMNEDLEVIPVALNNISMLGLQGEQLSWTCLLRYMGQGEGEALVPCIYLSFRHRVEIATRVLLL
jgi:hypothetical protein